MHGMNLRGDMHSIIIHDISSFQRLKTLSYFLMTFTLKLLGWQSVAAGRREITYACESRLIRKRCLKMWVLKSKAVRKPLFGVKDVIFQMEMSYFYIYAENWI